MEIIIETVVIMVHFASDEAWIPPAWFLIKPNDIKNNAASIGILTSAPINNEIKNASTKQDIFILKKKIDILENYNNNLPSKNYEIVDALYNIKYAYKRKAKKLGINL